MSNSNLTPDDGLECDGCGNELQATGFEYDQEDGFYICEICGCRTPDDIEIDSLIHELGDCNEI